jgi:predicted DNA-binding ribbon-helix-helix protein
MASHRPHLPKARTGKRGCGVVLVGHGLRRATVRAAHKRYGGNTRRCEGGLSGQLRQMARLGNDGRIRLSPRLTLFSVRAAPGRKGSGPMSRQKGRRAKSTGDRHAVSIAGRKTSVSLENAFWQSLKEIASEHDMTPSELVADINSKPRDANLSSAIRLFVLDFYRQQISVSKRPDRKG